MKERKAIIFGILLLASVIYFILACFNRHRKGILIANICLFAAVLLQFEIFHLFVYF